MSRLLNALSLATLIIACGPPSPAGGGGGSGRGGTACVVDTECNGNQTCEQGVCTDASGCQTSADCRDGEVCTDGACQTGNRSCTDIRDCPAGQTCDNNQCVPQGASCTADRDCDRGETCVNERCRAGDGTCTTDGDCPVGQSCRDGECLTTGGGGGDDCLRDRDCPAGQICDNGSCIAEGSCTNDRDCPVGQACQNGQCIEMGGGGCRTHEQCQGTQICIIPPGEAGGTCQSLVGQRCTTDSDCDFEDTERRGTAGACEGGRCKVDQFGVCTGNTDCAQDLSCTALQNNSLCLKECRDNSVCDSTLKCESEISRCWYNFCGNPRELSQGWQNVNNGNLGGTCNADGTNDGTCVEVSAGDNEWVGLCIEGGTQPVGQNCLFETERSDNGNQCVGGARCHFNNDRRRGSCVSSCAPQGSHGSVACRGGTRCLAGRCLSQSQICNPGTSDNCGPAGLCALNEWESDDGFCIVQEMNTVRVGSPCESTDQCVDGSLCLTLRQGEGSNCVALCRPAGGGQACANGTVCSSLGELSQNEIGGNWGLCVTP